MLKSTIVQTAEDIRQSVVHNARFGNIPVYKNGNIVAEDESFKFWHEKEHTRSTLRPRIRRYEGRKEQS